MNDSIITKFDCHRLLEESTCPCGKHKSFHALITLSDDPDRSVCTKCYYDCVFDLAEALQAKRVKEAQAPDTQEEVAG